MRLGVVSRRKFSTDRWFWGYPGNEQYVKAQNVVLWDMNNSPFPSPPTQPDRFYDFHRTILQVLKNAGYKGRTMFRGYGDLHKLPFPSYLLPAGHDFCGNTSFYTHTPSTASDKDGSFKAITTYIEDTLLYTRPAMNCLVISSDERFLSALNLLKVIQYNILVARPENATKVLDEFATNIWYLEHLFQGGNSMDCAGKDIRPWFESKLPPVRQMNPSWAEGNLSTAEIIGFWDIHTAPLPIDVKPEYFIGNIRGNLWSAGYRGNFTLQAYGDENVIPYHILEQLLSTPGVSYTHLVSDGCDATFNRIFADILLSTRSNKPPTNYLVISAEYYFFEIALKTLQQASYNTFGTTSSKLS